MCRACPDIGELFPEFLTFSCRLAEEYGAGQLRSAEGLTHRVKETLTPEVLRAMGDRIPGWTEMSEAAGGKTLVHVVSTFVALLSSPEHRSASAEERRRMTWSLLLHDLAKRPDSGNRDSAHAFRSGVLAARALPGLGFPTTRHYEAVVEGWSQLTAGAIRERDGTFVLDSRALPEIVSGLERMFGRLSCGFPIVMAILLHNSLDTVRDWPPPAALTEEEMRRFLDPRLLGLLGAVIMADSSAWHLFDSARLREYRVEIRRALGRAAEIVRC